jgi:hypothetical protein
MTPACPPRSQARQPQNASRPHGKSTTTTSTVRRSENGNPNGNAAPLSYSPQIKDDPAGPSWSSPTPLVGKSKRVRTGCLTCRERHLKCDEGLPECNNCRKSSRECRRGIRLNFIDIQVKDPPCLPRTADWSCSLFSALCLLTRMWM